MSNKFFLLLAFVALAQLGGCARAAGDSAMPTPVIEESTESPIADMALIDADMKTSTEKPPVMAAGEVMTPKAEVAMPEAEKPTHTHTVADFIIHPLIAFKPRQVEDISALGKQASDGGSTTVAPWPLFSFNAGQSIGSSVSSLAGSVSNWLTDRIQLPGLVDTPVRESTTTSTTTTTTQRPDIVVRVQTKGSTRRPIIRIQNNNRPNRLHNNNQLDSEEFDDDEYDDDDEEFNGNRFDEELEEDDDNSGVEEYDDEQSNEEDEDIENDDEEEEEEIVQRPNHRRRPVQQQQRRKPQQQQQAVQNQRRRPQNGQRQQSVAPNRRRHPVQQLLESEEEEVEDDDTEESQDDSADFYYGQQQSTKRSQPNQPNFIQRGQQNLINQIRQFTRGQTPGEIGSQIRKTQQAQTSSGNSRRRPQQATLLVNRNGQTVYVAPELLNLNAIPATVVNAPNYQFPQQTVTKKRVPASAYPQPPLSTPVKRKGRPTQYITIPWSQLGISPPDQQLVSITDGIQSQPLILNIPQSAINTMQAPTRKKKRPVMTPDTVPLLADASLMDIFKPPKIPPSRTSTVSTSNNNGPVIIATRPKPVGSKGSQALLPARIRPGTIVEKAPASADTPMQSAETDDQTAAATSSISHNSELRKGDSEFIIVGDDSEPGVTRQVQPVFGDARYISLGDLASYQRRFAMRKSGRALDQEEPVDGAAAESIPEAIVEVASKKVSEDVPAEVSATDVPAEVSATDVPAEVSATDVPAEVSATDAPLPKAGDSTEENAKMDSTTNEESKLQAQLKEAIIEAIEKKIEVAPSDSANASESSVNPEAAT